MPTNTPRNDASSEAHDANLTPLVKAVSETVTELLKNPLAFLTKSLKESLRSLFDKN